MQLFRDILQLKGLLRESDCMFMHNNQKAANEEFDGTKGGVYAVQTPTLCRYNYERGLGCIFMHGFA